MVLVKNTLNPRVYQGDGKKLSGRGETQKCKDMGQRSRGLGFIAGVKDRGKYPCQNQQY